MAISPETYDRAGVEAVLVFLVAKLLRSLTDDDYRAVAAMLATTHEHKNGTARVERIGEP